MMVRLRTERYVSVEMTELQAKQLSLFFEGLQESEISAAITRVKGMDYKYRGNIHETVQTFRLILIEQNKLSE